MVSVSQCPAPINPLARDVGNDARAGDRSRRILRIVGLVRQSSAGMGRRVDCSFQKYPGDGFQYAWRGPENGGLMACPGKGLRLRESGS